MSRRRNVRWGPCPFCGAEGWDVVSRRQSNLFDHDRPGGGRCRKAAEQYEAGKAAGLAAIEAAKVRP